MNSHELSTTIADALAQKGADGVGAANPDRSGRRRAARIGRLSPGCG
jgi:hypothetical protein